VEFDVVWRAQGFDDIPLILDMPSPGATSAERAEVTARAWTALAERELADGQGSPRADLAAALGVIAHRRQSLHLRVVGRDALRAMLATKGQSAVLARLAGEQLRVATLASSGLITALLSVMPDAPPGRGHSVNVAVDTFAEAARASTPSAGRDVLIRHGVNRTDARALLDMTTGSVRTGQVAAELRRPDGRITRSDRVVAFHDTRSGRYLAIRDAGHLTVSPATRATLARAVRELVIELRGADD
jgi:hypothetical protein